MTSGRPIRNGLASGGFATDAVAGTPVAPVAGLAAGDATDDEAHPPSSVPAQTRRPATPGPKTRDRVARIT